MATQPRHDGTPDELTPTGERRRDFIFVATGAFAAAGAATVLWPLINQMNPSADVLALAQIDLDLSAIQPGQAIKVSWRGKPVFRAQPDAGRAGGGERGAGRPRCAIRRRWRSGPSRGTATG